MNVPREAVLLFMFALAASFAGETNTLRGTITVDGLTYSNVTWHTVTPATVTIFHQTGVAAIPLEKLPPELQKQFGYDPQKAADYRSAEAVRLQRAAKETAERRAREQAETDEGLQKLSELDTPYQQRQRALAQQQASELAAAKTNPVAVFVKDVKDFPEALAESGKPVRLICEIENFERIDSGEFEGQYKLDAVGLASYATFERSTYRAIGEPDFPLLEHDFLQRDGTHLMGFLVIPRERHDLVMYCHDKLDAKHTYRANVLAWIRKSSRGTYYGEVYDLERVPLDE
ncbi:MAG: hypothetical protein ABSA12_14265 [Verrucomicrobiia bacterium]